MGNNQLSVAFLIVKNISRGGGIEKYTLELGRRLVLRGHHVTVYSMNNYGLVEKERDGMKIIKIPTVNYFKLEKIVATLVAVIHIAANRKKYDVVHCHSVVPGAASFLLHLLGIPTVLQMHGIEWQRPRWGDFAKVVLRMFEILSFRNNELITAVSKKQCKYYSDLYGKEIKYIPTGTKVTAPPFPKHLNEFGLQPEGYILFAGRLVPDKGVHLLIKAFRDTTLSCKLVIAGDCTGEDQYKVLLHELAGNDERIVFLGFLEGQPMQELYAYCRLFVLPSAIEGLSLSLLEAMSYGRLCLVSDIPENIEAIGESGYVFKSGDTQDLKDKLKEILLQETLSSSIGAEARERVLKNYSWEVITKEYEEIYEKSISGMY